LTSIDGRTVLERSVAAFLTHPAVSEVVVALPREVADDPPAYLRSSVKPVRLVAGGARRQDSVASAFRAASERSDIIVVHDAARPFASADLIARTIAAAVESGAALAAVQAQDTVKRAVRQAGPTSPKSPKAPTGTTEAVSATVAMVPMVDVTLPRESIFLAQTPQAFRRQVLQDALALGALGAEGTDEAALAEQAGHAVRIVEGEASNIKITTPADLVIAHAIARGERGAGSSRDAATTLRIGTGYDLHRLVEDRPLVLGGVTIPFERGLLGHSDADAICHAVTDAILGAAAAGDIGRLFPDTDPNWRGASSVDLLRRAVVAVGERGYDVANVDVVVIAERPKLGPHIDAMRGNVAQALGVEIDRVSIKGKTNEGVGEVGRGEAIAVHAIALLNAR
jgi:2-C-methyl-D-erythritol 4-phosphate cytidylyltransferase/2-C-methyl-D-erythritol 2,4-cyclodiphosphate synthase